MCKKEHELEVVNIRLVKEPSLYSEKPLNSPEAIIDLMTEELSSYDREVMCILNMHTDGRCINLNIASVGTVDHTIASPREIFKSAILANAANVILLHNHLGNSPKPSREDLITTRKLEECGELLGIPVLDHIIIAGGNKTTYSFCEHNQMKGQVHERNFAREEKATRRKPPVGVKRARQR